MLILDRIWTWNVRTYLRPGFTKLIFFPFPFLLFILPLTTEKLAVLWDLEKKAAYSHQSFSSALIYIPCLCCNPSFCPVSRDKKEIDYENVALDLDFVTLTGTLERTICCPLPSNNHLAFCYQILANLF